MATIQLTANAEGGVFAPGTYNAGDVLILPPICSYVFIGPQYNEDPNNPIIIRNGNGVAQVTSGIDLTDAQGVKVTGSGDSAIQYGIVCDSGSDPFPTQRSSGGHAIKGYAKNVTIERTDVIRQGFGVYLKNEPSCDIPLNDWEISNVVIQNNRFTRIYMEGIYCGSTNYPLPAGHMQRDFECGGQPFYRLPGQLSNIKILNNIFDETGRAAIQLSFASGTESEVAYNEVIQTGLQGFFDQGNGINFGHYSKVWVHHNTVSQALYASIAGTGSGMQLRIEDNTLANQGNYSAIWLDTRNIAQLRKGKFDIRRNSIGVVQGDADIRVYDERSAQLAGWENNYLIGNTKQGGAALKLDIANGITYSTSGGSTPPPPTKKILFTRTVTLSGLKKTYLIYNDGTWLAK